MMGPHTRGDWDAETCKTPRTDRNHLACPQETFFSLSPSHPCRLCLSLSQSHRWHFLPLCLLPFQCVSVQLLTQHCRLLQSQWYHHHHQSVQLQKHEEHWKTRQPASLSLRALTCSLQHTLHQLPVCTITQ